jgi:hypothetical protein
VTKSNKRGHDRSEGQQPRQKSPKSEARHKEASQPVKISAVAVNDNDVKIVLLVDLDNQQKESHFLQDFAYGDVYGFVGPRMQKDFHKLYPRMILDQTKSTTREAADYLLAYSARDIARKYPDPSTVFIIVSGDIALDNVRYLLENKDKRQAKFASNVNECEEIVLSLLSGK